MWCVSVNEVWMETPYPNRGFNLINISELSCSLQHYSQFKFKIWKQPVSTNGWIDKKMQYIYVYNVILFSHEKEWTPAISDNLDEPWGHYAKWSKSDKDKYYMISHIWDLKSQTQRNTKERNIVELGGAGGGRNEILSKGTNSSYKISGFGDLMHSMAIIAITL